MTTGRPKDLDQRIATANAAAEELMQELKKEGLPSMSQTEVNARFRAKVTQLSERQANTEPRPD
jgi:hypothetical protein